LESLISIKNALIEPRWTPRHRPHMWGTSFGAWGDTLIDLGTFKHFVGRGGMIHFGMDPTIQEFICKQSFIDECVYVKPKDRGDYEDCYFYASRTPIDEDQWPARGVIARTDIDPFTVVSTHISAALMERRRAYHWSGARLPHKAWSWAREFKPDGEFYVLHPYSFNSSPIEDHWPLWEQAIAYLLSYTPHHYVLTGMGYEVDIFHPRLHNRLNLSNTMMDVFALCDMSQGIITTSSALSHYSVIQNIPALVIANKPLGHPDSYFRRWLNSPNVELVEFDDNIGRFITQVNRILK